MPPNWFSPSSDWLLKHGPIIPIVIGWPLFETNENVPIALQPAEPRQIHALIDTGASLTIVNPALARTLKLQQTGEATIYAAGSSGTYPEFAASISFPGTSLPNMDIVRIVGCPLASQVMSCLIGRDVLKNWELTYNGLLGRFSIQRIS